MQFDTDEGVEILAGVADKRIVVYGYQIMTDSENDGVFTNGDENLSLVILSSERGGLTAAYCPTGLFWTAAGEGLTFEPSDGRWSGNVQYSIET